MAAGGGERSERDDAPDQERSRGPVVGGAVTGGDATARDDGHLAAVGLFVVAGGRDGRRGAAALVVGVAVALVVGVAVVLLVVVVVVDVGDVGDVGDVVALVVGVVVSLVDGVVAVL